MESPGSKGMAGWRVEWASKWGGISLLQFELRI